MDDGFLGLLESTLEGIDLTEDELRFIRWVAGLDMWTVQQVTQIIRKCREPESETVTAMEKSSYESELRAYIELVDVKNSHVLE